MTSLVNWMGLVCAVASPGGPDTIAGAWSGPVSLGEDTRELALEIGPGSSPIVRWSIEGTGFLRLPLDEVSLDAATGALSGSLRTFGAHQTGEIRATLENGALSGTLRWQEHKVPFRLRPRPPSLLPYTEQMISIVNGPVTLAGTLVLPRTEGPFPAVVFLHGSGPSRRGWGLYLAHHFAAIGIASLLHDKRGCGASTGSWMRASLDDLARDGRAAVESAKKHPRIDADRVGVLGVSQGGWVTSRLSALSPDLAFAIVNSGGGVRPREAELYTYRRTLRDGGVSESNQAAALKLVDKYFAFLETGEQREILAKEIEAARAHPWYSFLNLHRILVSEENRRYWEWVATYDPRPDILTMHFPILLLFGDADVEQPTTDAVRAWREGLLAGGNSRLTVKIFPGAGHGLRAGGHHGPGRGWPRYCDGYLEYHLAWLREHVTRRP